MLYTLATIALAAFVVLLTTVLAPWQLFVISVVALTYVLDRHLLYPAYLHYRAWRGHHPAVRRD